MPQVARSSDRSEPARRISHSRETALAVLALACGVAAFFTGFFQDTYLIALILGVIGFFTGLYCQLISVTTTERWLNVVGMGGAFVGVGLALSHSGLS